MNRADGNGVSFDTWAGHCRIDWSTRGIARIGLVAKPCSKDDGIRIPLSVKRTMRQLDNYFNGKAQTFDPEVLDLDGLTPFHRSVYREAISIPSGETVTYGEIAKRMKRAGASRAVGGALSRNPFLIVVPCHRVIASTGHLTGFSAIGGLSTKARLLALERTGTRG